MKKIFPVIVVLITLSLLGIMIIQMSWIRNAIYLKRETFQRQLESSLSQSKDELQSRYLIKEGLIVNPNDNTSKEWFLQNFTSQVFSKDEIQKIVGTALKK